ncbi:MAG: hypothetical protein JSR34_12275 [Proteobacteria bacterium]|nr:hypothetical protein [Pseudomonadota bacterium]
MGESGPASQDPAAQGQGAFDPASLDPAPLNESARAVYAAARGLAGAWGGHAGALRRLLVADLALAKSALAQGLLLLVVAGVALGTAWLLLVLLAVWGLHRGGLDWGWAMGIPLLASAALGAGAVLLALRALKQADLQASRRQLAAWWPMSDAGDSAAAAGTPHNQSRSKDARP